MNFIQSKEDGTRKPYDKDYQLADRDLSSASTVQTRG